MRAVRGGFELGLGCGGLDDFGEVGLDLQLGVMSGVDARGPVDLLALGEDGAGHLELAKLSGEGEHTVTGGLSLLHVGEAIAEGGESVEGDEMLIFKHGADSAGQLLVDSLTVGGVLTRAGKEIDDSAGRGVGLAAGCEELAKGLAGGVEELGGGGDFDKRIHHLLPGVIEGGGGDLSLTGENLPEADVGLEGSEGVAAEGFVGDFVDGAGYADEAGCGFAAEIGEFGEDEIPVIELRELAGEQADCFWRETFFGGAAVVDLAHGEVDLEGAGVSDDSGKGDHGVEKLFRSFEITITLVPLVDGLRIGLLMEDVAPCLEVSGNVGLTVGFPFEASKEDEQLGSLTEDSAGGRRKEVGSAEVVVEALEASVFEEVLALGVADAGEDVEVDGQPAIVFGEEVGDELTWVFGAGSGEIFPTDLGPGTSGNDDAVVTNGDLAAVEVESSGVGKEASESRRSDQGGSGFGVVFGESPVEASDEGIVDEEIDEAGVAFFLARAEGDPVALVKEHRDARGWIGIGERHSLLECLLEIGERESGVDGEEGSFGICGFEEEVFLSACFAQAIAEDLNEGAGVVAVSDAEGLRRAGEDLKLACLLDVAIDQTEVLGGSVALVALHEDIAGQ